MNPASKVLMELALLGLKHGLDSVDEGGPLIPFAIIEDASGRHLQRFLANGGDNIDLGRSLEEARKWLKTQHPVRAVLVYDGYIEKDGNRSDAIYAEAFESLAKRTLCLAQPYSSASEVSRATRLGSVVDCGDRAT